MKRRWWSRGIVVACLAFALVSPASAAEAPPGADALGRARTFWEKGSIAKAEPLYREAIEKGGLAPDEILEGYVRIGTARAVRGKKDQAIAAFRAASVLDSTFTVPRQAGKRGAAYAARAKKDTAKVGSIQLTVEGPNETPAGKSFHVTAHLDAPHVQIAAKVGLIARDGTSAKEVTVDSKPPQESIDFEIPADIALPSASIVVRVDALDAHNNVGSPGTELEFAL